MLELAQIILTVLSKQTIIEAVMPTDCGERKPLAQQRKELTGGDDSRAKESITRGAPLQPPSPASWRDAAQLSPRPFSAVLHCCLPLLRVQWLPVLGCCLPAMFSKLAPVCSPLKKKKRTKYSVEKIWHSGALFPSPHSFAT